MQRGNTLRAEFCCSTRACLSRQCWANSRVIGGRCLVKYVYDPVSSKMPLTNTSAITAYEKTLRGIFIYKYAESYCRVSVIDLVFQWGMGGAEGYGAICDSEIYTGGMSQQIFYEVR